MKKQRCPRLGSGAGAQSDPGPSVWPGTLGGGAPGEAEPTGVFFPRTGAEGLPVQPEVTSSVTVCRRARLPAPETQAAALGGEPSGPSLPFPPAAQENTPGPGSPGALGPEAGGGGGQRKLLRAGRSSFKCRVVFLWLPGFHWDADEMI